MSEALEQLDAAPEVIAQEQAAEPVAETAEQPREEAKEVPSRDQVQEQNWKAARAKMEADEREKALLKHKADLLAQELEFLRQSQAKKAEPAVDEEQDFTDTEKRLYREIKNLREEVKSTRAKEADYVQDRLRAKYPDFDEVVTSENVTYLQTNNASLAKAIAALKDDPYEQGLAAYDALKRTDWYQQRHIMADKAKVEENSKKPVSVNAVRKQGALSEANRFAGGLTPDLKKVLQQEMAAARKGA